jgi:hypothetical protein
MRMEYEGGWKDLTNVEMMDDGTVMTTKRIKAGEELILGGKNLYLKLRGVEWEAAKKSSVSPSPKKRKRTRSSSKKRKSEWPTGKDETYVDGDDE